MNKNSLVLFFIFLFKCSIAVLWPGIHFALLQVLKKIFIHFNLVGNYLSVGKVALRDLEAI